MDIGPNSQLVIHQAEAAGLPVVTGCPFPLSAVPAKVLSAEVSVGASRVPAQCVELSPSGCDTGTRWFELSFLARSAGIAQVSLLSAEADEKAPIARQTAHEIILDNGCFRVILDARPDQVPLRVEQADGTVLGTMCPEMVTQGGLVHHDNPGAERRFSLLRNGSIRAQAELHGQLQAVSGEDSLSYRLTVEVWQGLNALRVDWMCAHLVSGVPEMAVQRLGLLGHWQVGENPTRHFRQKNYSPLFVPREVYNPAPVSLETDFSCGPVHVADPAMLLDDSEYAAYLAPPLITTDTWLGVRGDKAAVYATVRDFCASRPNRLESLADALHFYLIPSGNPVSWPQGRRREQTLFLSFPGLGEENPVQQLNALDTWGRAQPTPETLAALGAFEIEQVLPAAPGGSLRFNAVLDRLCRLNTPGDKWNLGDTPDDGYTRTYAPIPNDLYRLPGAPEFPLRFNPAGSMLWPQIAGNFMEPVWTNNEYDVIHTIATEILRTGREFHMDMLRWTSRHTVEVDFVAFSDDPWHHRATPFHSHFHNLKGAISSHFWTQGLLQYYFLSGDRDALEVALALGDKIIELNSSAARVWKFDREIGWALLSLVCLVEAGFDRYRGECDRIAGYLQQYDRAAFSGAVNLSNGREGQSLERQMIGNIFGYASMVEAMDRYQKVTGNPETAVWLETLLQQMKQAFWEAVNESDLSAFGALTMQVMAIGFERTGEEDFLTAGMVTLDNQFFCGNPAVAAQVKPCAANYRALCRFLGHTFRAGLLDRFEYPSILTHRLAR